jgi:hypothetical protein
VSVVARRLRDPAVSELEFTGDFSPVNRPDRVSLSPLASEDADTLVGVLSARYGLPRVPLEVSEYKLPAFAAHARLTYVKVVGNYWPGHCEGPNFEGVILRTTLELQKGGRYEVTGFLEGSRLHALTVGERTQEPRPQANPSSGPEVDIELVELFNRAAAAGREGRNTDALDLYRKVLRRHAEGGLNAVPLFLALTHTQAGYALIDLGRLDEACAEFASVPRGVLEGSSLYAYYFAYGNTLGGLGRIEEMFSVLVSAISAAEDLDDFSVRPLACWKKILGFAAQAKEWQLVSEYADKAAQVAGVRQLPELAEYAAGARELARRELKLG